MSTILAAGIALTMFPQVPQHCLRPQMSKADFIETVAEGDDPHKLWAMKLYLRTQTCGFNLNLGQFNPDWDMPYEGGKLGDSPDDFEEPKATPRRGGFEGPRYPDSGTYLEDNRGRGHRGGTTSFFDFLKKKHKDKDKDWWCWWEDPKHPPVDVAAVPLPAPLLMLLSGVFGLALFRKKGK